MACGCKNKSNNNSKSNLLKKQPEVVEKFSTAPTDECIYCAEKHFGSVLSLMHQYGYKKLNFIDINDQIVNAQLDIFETDFKLAQKLRDLRHYWNQKNQIPEQLVNEIAQMFKTYTNNDIEVIQIIGELTTMTWHLRDEQLKKKIRLFRHKIQRKETISEQNVKQIINYINSII